MAAEPPGASPQQSNVPKGEPTSGGSRLPLVDASIPVTPAADASTLATPAVPADGVGKDGQPAGSAGLQTGSFAEGAFGERATLESGAPSGAVPIPTPPASLSVPVLSQADADLQPPSPLSRQSMPGTPLGDSYLIGRVLGHGGLGVTYLAWDTSLATRVAIKEFLPDAMAGRNPGSGEVTIHTGHEAAFAHALARFQQEGRILARFQQHPGIVSVYRAFTANGTGYLLMEYVAGTTLRQYLENHGGKIPWPRALELLAPVMDTLAEVHQAGLLHRDIGPSNIYLTHDGQVKLLDFGAAREVSGDRSVTLSVVLKEGYAPWEQYQPKARQGPWTDLYALSATLYRAITGQLPPTAPDRIEEDHLRPPSALGVDIPEAHEAVLMKGLAIRQEDRWQTIGEMRGALEEAEKVVEKAAAERGVAEEVLPAPEKLPPASPDKYTRINTRLNIFIATITAIGVVIASVMLFLHLKDPPDPASGGKQQATASADGVGKDGQPAGSAGLQAGSFAEGAFGEEATLESGAPSDRVAGGERREPPVAIEPPGASPQQSNVPKGEPTSGGSRLPLVDASTPATPAADASTPATPAMPADGVGKDGQPAGSAGLQTGSFAEGAFGERATLESGAPSGAVPEPPPPEPARLIIRSNVMGDTVFIDGEPVGATGPNPHELEAGEYKVGVSGANPNRNGKLCVGVRTAHPNLPGWHESPWPRWCGWGPVERAPSV